MSLGTYCYTTARLDECGCFSDGRLTEVTERHRIDLHTPPLHVTVDPCEDMKVADAEGMVIGMIRGWPGRSHLQLVRRIHRRGRKAWFHWPREEAIELVDRERLRSYMRLWAALQLMQRFSRGKGTRPPASSTRGDAGNYDSLTGEIPNGRTRPIHSQCLIECEEIVAGASPVPFPDLPGIPTAGRRLPGTGAYLRTDYWAKISSGGSYGHTCYVAKSLAAVTSDFVCFMPHRYTLLDDLGVHQVVLDCPSRDSNETSLLRANGYYYQALKTACKALRPAYLYERLCLGNYVGARLSLELGIPHIVEYNGSEISMNRSFGGKGYTHEDVFLKAEEAAFRQATLISVVSDPIREDLIRRGIAAEKILVNPNGVDLGAYAPAEPAEKARIRSELGFREADRVIGFIGTFGGWHGIDVLAESIPQVCERAPNVRFLIIGDGNFKHLIDERVAKHGLEDKVIRTGRIPQKEGARLMRACDVLVSPHNSHMVDSRFFGSPTKIFEYMALGAGIVASDLEQIGTVLSPALRTGDLKNRSLGIGDQRAVLCTPGDTPEFVESILALAARQDWCRALGRNAREAAARDFSWDRHVSNLWRFQRGEFDRLPWLQAARRQEDSMAAGRHEESRSDNDYKHEIQKQWDHDPCGSHYVKRAQPRTLEWFLEAEAYRYGKYAPWMPKTMEFNRFAGKQVLEIGGGMGTDLAQFAKNGAAVTDLDLSAGHLKLAQENFRLRNLSGRFIQHDAESLPFDDGSFDLVYSNGVIHHTPNTARAVQEMFRVLKPGGRVIAMVYAENSFHYWCRLVYCLGVRESLLDEMSMGEIMSRHVEISDSGARPLVKVYTKARLLRMFHRFRKVRILQRQMMAEELPRTLKWLPLKAAGQLMGWNLVVKADR